MKFVDDDDDDDAHEVVRLCMPANINLSEKNFRRGTVCRSEILLNKAFWKEEEVAVNCRCSTFTIAPCGRNYFPSRFGLSR